MPSDSIDWSSPESIRKALIHTHLTTNLASIGSRPTGQCAACDYASSAKSSYAHPWSY